MAQLDDTRVRMAVFEWLERLSQRFGDVPPYDELRRGVVVGGERINVVSQRGIFKPRQLALPLSIKTSPTGPYEDAFSGGNLLQYKYCGQDPSHPDNRGLRAAMKRQIPLVYFFGLGNGRYLPVWPVFVVGDDPDALNFTIAVDELSALASSMPDSVSEREPEWAAGEPDSQIRRRYITSTTRQRLHQASFRERVIRAYRTTCALCRLRHVELLEAAHITPDADEGGEPVISNGLSLCKIHHAAYDKNILGIRPDYVAEVRHDILEEIDGPMLRHGLQEMNGVKLIVPHRVQDRPDPARLEKRYEVFTS